MSQLPIGSQIPPQPAQQPPTQTPPVESVAKPPEGPYGFPPAEYEIELQAAQNYIDARSKGDNKGDASGQPRDSHGRFTSNQQAAGTLPAESSLAPALDPQLVAEAANIGLTDLTGITNSNDLHTKIGQTKFEAAHNMARILGVDPGEMAEFFRSRAALSQAPTQTAPSQAPVNVVVEPVPQPQAFSLTAEEEENMTPQMAAVVKRMAQEFNKNQGVIPKPAQDEIAALKQKVQQFEQAQAQRQQWEMSQVWDEAAQANGLTQLFGASPSAVLAANKAGNQFAPGVSDWSGFVQQFFTPTYQRLLQQGHPDQPQTVHAAMAQAKQLAQQRWSQLAGVQSMQQQIQYPPMPVNGNGNGHYAQQPPAPQGVIRSEPRRAPEPTPYMGTTYEDTMRGQMLEEEEQRWAANGGRNPYHRSW